MADYKNLYEKQYREKKLINSLLGRFWGLRKFLKKYDWDRYFIAEQLIEPGGKILDIGWDGGHIHCFTMNKFCWLFESTRFSNNYKKWERFFGEV